VDAGIHLLVVAGLAHAHLALGVAVPHGVLHAAEGVGLGVAVLSTVAAAGAEVLAARARAPPRSGAAGTAKGEA
jgi:hypothetical protein